MVHFSQWLQRAGNAVACLYMSCATSSVKLNSNCPLPLCTMGGLTQVFFTHQRHHWIAATAVTPLWWICKSLVSWARAAPRQPTALQQIVPWTYLGNMHNAVKCNGQHLAFTANDKHPSHVLLSLSRLRNQLSTVRYAKFSFATCF